MGKILREKNEENVGKYFGIVKKFKILNNIYGNNITQFYEEFENGDLSKKKKVISILNDTVQKKLDELIETKIKSAKNNWHEIAVKNFHKSLDHRSFYFKKYEKKLTSQLS